MWLSICSPFSQDTFVLQRKKKSSTLCPVLYATSTLQPALCVNFSSCKFPQTYWIVILPLHIGCISIIVHCYHYHISFHEFANYHTELQQNFEQICKPEFQILFYTHRITEILTKFCHYLCYKHILCRISKVWLFDTKKRYHQVNDLNREY